MYRVKHTNVIQYTKPMKCPSCNSYAAQCMRLEQLRNIADGLTSRK